MRIFLPFTFGLVLAGQAVDFTAEGNKALDARQYAQAIEWFQKAVSAEPASVASHFDLALAYSLSGKDAEAIAEYNRVLELKPGLYEAELNLGISLVRSKDDAAAVPHFERAVEQRPGEARAVLALADALFATKDFAGAGEVYRKALALNGGSGDAELGLGRSLAGSGKVAEGEPHYRAAVRADSQNRDYLLELAEAYERTKQPREAMRVYREFPENAGAQERLGFLELASGDGDAAIEVLQGVVAKSPTTANRVALAQAYARKQQPAKAEPLVAQALPQAPNDFDLRMFYARLLRDQRKFPQAAAQFQASAQLRPDSAEAWTELAGALQMADDNAGALRALDQVHALGGETAGHYFIRAMTLDKLGQRQEAIENYKRFLETSRGQNPDQEFQARQRVKTLENAKGKK